MFWLNKTLRLGHLLVDFRLRRQNVRGKPFRLWIETASCCNLRCVMCPNKEMAADKKGLMPLSLFKKIIDQCRWFANDVYLHHRGEPLLNPALFDMISYAREAGLRTRFHTNGALLDETRAKKLLEASPNLVSFSFDCFSKEAYEKVRGGAVFEKTLENILRLAQMRKAAGVTKPYLVVEKIRFKNLPLAINQRQADDTTRRLLTAGVDEIIEKEEYIWAEESAPATVAARPGSVCTFPWYAMVICADGAVTPCPQDFNACMKMGNAAETALLAIWNGKAYRDLRKKMAGDLQALPLCRKCDRLGRRTFGGLPIQYMLTFLIDHLLGYGKLRKMLGTQERN